jgi:hypothetical protein
MTLFKRFAKQKDDVRVIGSFKEHVTNEEFRLTTDKPNVIRLIQDRPEKMSKELARSVKVSGLSYRMETVNKFIEGKNRKIELEYEPSKEYPQAIKVLGLWEDQNGINKEQIGYVEDDIAKWIHEGNKKQLDNIEDDIAKWIHEEHGENVPIGATLWTIYKPYEGKDTGIRICIWQPSSLKYYYKQNK